MFRGSALALQKAELFAVTEMKWPWEDEFCGCTRKPVDVSPCSKVLLGSIVVLGGVCLILDRICALPSSKMQFWWKVWENHRNVAKSANLENPDCHRPFFSRFSTCKKYEEAMHGFAGLSLH